MYSVQLLDLLKKMKEAIDKEETGSRKQFARFLGISENTLWNYIQIFKKRDIPVKFSKSANSYIFDINDDEEEIRLVWEFGLYRKE